MIETMQRCVLAGLPAVPLGIESASSLRKRWMVLGRKKINASLAEIAGRSEVNLGKILDSPKINKRKIPAGAPMDSSKKPDGGTDDINAELKKFYDPEADQHDTPLVDPYDTPDFDQYDIAEIHDVLEKLLQNGPRDDLLVQFAGLAQESEADILSIALVEIEESHSGIRDRIIDAINVCKTDEFVGRRFSQEGQKKLRRLFAKN